MSGNDYRKIVLEKIIAEETRKAAERLGHLNHIDLDCLKKDLSPEECMEVYEGILRNIMKICESRLKNSFSRKERYIATKKNGSTFITSKKPDGWIPPVGKFD